MFTHKAGITIINNALESFSKVALELDKGIERSALENEASEANLKATREAFEAAQQVLETNIAVNTVAIRNAENVKGNLTKLLTGKL